MAQVTITMFPLLLLLWAASHPGAAVASQLFANQQEVSSSLVVNQLAILKMMGDSLNSCSSVMPNIMDKLEAQLLQNKQDLHGSINDLLGQITELKNETTSGFEDMKGDLRSILEVYQEEVTTYKSQVNNITGKVTIIEDQHSSLENVTATLLASQNIQEEAINDHNAQIRSLTNQVEILEEKVLNNTLEKMLEELKRTQIALQEEISVYKGQVSYVSSELQKEINTRNSQVSSLNTELQGEINTCKSQVSFFNTELERKINTWNSQVANHTTQITTLEGKVQINSLLTQFTRGEAAPATCSTSMVLTEMTRSISVVNSGTYTDNLDCEWKVTLPVGTKILLKWSYLETEFHSTCSYDFVSVIDVTRSNQLVYGKKLCGSHLPGNTLIDSNEVNIVFHSDGSNVFRGFGLDYQGISPVEMT